MQHKKLFILPPHLLFGTADISVSLSQLSEKH